MLNSNSNSRENNNENIISNNDEDIGIEYSNNKFILID